MKRTWGFVCALLCLVIVGSAGIADCQTWTTLKNAPPVSVGAMLLLTDGRVLVHEEPNCSGSGCKGSSYNAWYTLTPDITGSYINGTWTAVASLPSSYAPLFFASAVLPDGKVIVQGGEYNCPSGNCADAWQSNGALYDPVANTWTSTTAPVPSSDELFGDAQSVVLPNGTWMVAACCAYYGGYTAFPDYFYFNESSLNFTTEASASDGETTEFDESGWNLLPNGNVLMVNVYLGQYNATAKGYAIYNPSTNTWTEYSSTAVQLWDSGCGNSSKASYELGPVMLMPNGTLFATGASECSAGNIATYNWSTNTWTGQGTFPGKGAANDAPGATEINGNAIVITSPYTGTFSSPLTIYEWNGTTLSTFPNVSRASSDSSYVSHLLVLPTGQIMFTDFSTTVQILTSAGTYQSAWQPTITTAPTNLTPGDTYSISGTQFNGVTTGAAYGDDFQDNTNYPLVQIVNTATGNVYYARTHGHSTMGVATGSTPVSTNFDVPATVPNGACTLYVVANGIPSAGWSCNVGSTLSSTTSVNSTLDPSVYGQSVSFSCDCIRLGRNAHGNRSVQRRWQRLRFSGNPGFGFGLVGQHRDAGCGNAHGHGGLLRRQQLHGQHRHTVRGTSRQLGDRGHGRYFQHQPVNLRPVCNAHRDHQRRVWTSQRPRTIEHGNRDCCVEFKHGLRHHQRDLRQSRNGDVHNVEPRSGDRYDYGHLLG